MSRFRPMIGHLLAFVVFVDGPPGSSAAFTADERTKLLRDCFAAVNVLHRIGEQWGVAQSPPVNAPCRFTVVSRSVQLPRDPNTLAGAPASFEQRDQVWMSEAYQALGFPGDSLDAHVEALRKGLNARVFLGLGVGDSFPVFITKYPSHHPAFVRHDTVVINGPALQAISHLSSNIDGVIAHEIGHIFDHSDEYSECGNTVPHGFFDTLNANCVITTGPRPSPRVPCLMDNNVHQICPATAEAWGWVDRDHDAFADLGVQAAITLPVRTTRPGEQFVIKGRNVWDARAVAFGQQVTDHIQVITPDEIHVRVPTGLSGVVTISVLTRAGMASGSPTDTSVTVMP